MTDGFNVTLGVDSTLAVQGYREYDMAARRSGRATDKMSKKMQRGEKSMAGMGNAAFRLRRALGVIGITGFSVAIFGATKAALGFSAAMSEVSTLIDDSFDPTNSLVGVVRQLSMEYAQAPVEQAKALYQVISAGAGDAAEATKTLTAANKLAVGGVTSVSIAADGLTSIMNAYGLAAQAAAGISDSMFVAMRAGKTTIGELSSAVGLLAPIAAGTGVSINEMLAATAALTKGGLSTAQAMTGLRQALANVLKPTRQAAQVAERLGIDFSATALKTKGLAGFMADLIPKIKGNTDAMVNLFGSVEGVNAVMALTSETGAADFVAILDDMGLGLDTLMEKFELVVEDMDGLKGAIEALVEPTIEAVRAADDLGIAFNVSALESKGLAEFMRELTDEADGNEKILTALFGSMRRYNAMMMLAESGGGKAMIAMLKEMQAALSQTDTAVNKITEDIAFQADQVKSKLTDSFLGFGITILDVVGPALRTLNEHFETVKKVASTTVNAVVVVVGIKLVGAFASAATGAGVLGNAIARVQLSMLGLSGAAKVAAGALGVFTVATNAAKTAMAFLGGPIGILLIATTALLTWSSAAETAEEKANRLSGGIETLIDRFKQLGEAGQEEALRETVTGIEETRKEIDNLKDSVEEVNKHGIYGGLGGGPESEAAKGRVRELTADIEHLEGALVTQGETFARQAEEAKGAAAEYAVAAENTHDLGGAVQAYTQTQTEAAEAAAERKRVEDELNAAMDRKEGIIAGLSKTESRRFNQLRSIILPLAEVTRVYENDLSILNKGLKETGATKEQVAIATANLTAEYDSAVRAIRAEQLVLTDAQKATKKFYEKMQDLGVAHDDAAKATLEHTREVSAWVIENTVAGLSQDKIIAGIKAMKKEFADKKMLDARKRIDAISIATNDAAKESVRYAAAVRQLILDTKAAGLSDEEYQQRLEDLRQQFIANREEIEAICPANKKARECTDHTTQAMQDAWKAATERMDGLFVDLWESAFKGFDDFVDGVKDTFKKMLAEMAHAALTRPIIVKIQTVIAEQMGIPGVPGGPEGGQGGPGAKGVWNLLRNPQGVMGHLLSGAAGIGAGMALGQLFGGSSTTSGVGAAVGAAVGSFIPVIGTFLGGVIGGALGGLLFGGKQTVTGAGVDLGISGGQVTGTQFTDMHRKGGLFRSSKRWTETSALDRQLMADMNEALDEAFGMVTAIGEALGATGDAFDSFNMATRRLDLKDLSEEQAAAKIEEFLVNAIGAGIEHFIRNTAELSDRLKDIVLKFRGNAEDMISAFEMAASIELALDIDPVVMATEQIALGQRNLLEIYQDQKAALAEVIAEYDGSLESLSAVAAATGAVRQSQVELAAAFILVGQSITAMVETTAQQIRNAGLTNEELYASNQSRIDALVADLDVAGSPEEIARLTEEINRLTLESFNLLDPEQQIELKQGFLDFLDEILAIGQTQVGAGLDFVGDEGGQLETDHWALINESMARFFSMNQQYDREVDLR
jgi:TP901 family phage tail tape measure protein